MLASSLPLTSFPSALWILSTFFSLERASPPWTLEMKPLLDQSGLCFNQDIQGGSQFSWTPISVFGNHRTLLPGLCRQTDVHLTRGRSSVEPTGVRLTGGGCDGCLQAVSSLVLWSWEVAESGSGNSRTWVLAFLLPRLAFYSLMLKQTQ